MGIDIYLCWEGMSEEDRDNQFAGFAIDKGHIGYLREAYHGNPYATHVLVAEAFDERNLPDEVHDPKFPDEPIRGVHIPASVLEERLPEAIKAAEERARKLYGEDGKDEVESLRNFVGLARALEDKGKRPIVHASW